MLPNRKPNLFKTTLLNHHESALKVFGLLNPGVATQLKAMNVIGDYQHLFEMLEKCKTVVEKGYGSLTPIDPAQFSIEAVLCLSAEKSAYALAKSHYVKRTGQISQMMPAAIYAFFSPHRSLWREIIKETPVETLNKDLLCITAALGGNLDFFENVPADFLGELKKSSLNNILIAATMSGNIKLMRLCIEKLSANKEARMNDLNLVVIALIFNHFDAVRYAFFELKLPAEYLAGTNMTPYQVNALLIAAELGSVPAMQMAVTELDIAPNSKDINENNALNLALQAGKEKAVDYALNDLQLRVDDSCNRFGQHPLILAIFSGKLALAEKIAEIVQLSPTNLVELDQADTHPGFYAVAAGDVDLLEWVHQYYPLSADLKNHRQNNLFLEACWWGNLQVARYCIDVLLIDPHATDQFRFNALHHAVNKQNITLLRYLIDDLQVNYRQKTAQGYEPIDYARGKKVFCFFLLLGANLTHPHEEAGRYIEDVKIETLMQKTRAEILEEYPDLADISSGCAIRTMLAS